MDGGRVKWEAEGREMSQEAPSFPGARYPTPQREDSKIRAFRDDVLAHLEKVRSSEGGLIDGEALESTGENCCTCLTTLRKEP